MVQGRISLLVDSPLRALAVVYRGAPADARKHINRETKSEGQPIWKQETAERATTRIQQKVLVNSARVGVTNRNVFLRSGAVGRLKSGTPVIDIASAAEFGRPPGTPVSTRSKNGTAYKRKTGAMFGARNRRGNVVHPAASASIKRLASLWVQTAFRSLYEAGEKVR